MSLDSEVYDVLKYLLNAVGDHQVEGEANSLLQGLNKVQQVPYSEDHPAAISDVTGDPRARQEAARAALAKAQADVAAADAAVAPLPPAAPAEPAEAPATDEVPAAPAF